MRIFKRKKRVAVVKETTPRHRLHFSLTGKNKRLIKRVALGVGAVIALALIVNALRVEPSISSSAEMLSLKERGVVRVGVRSDMPLMNADGSGFERELATILGQKLLPDADFLEIANPYTLVEVTSMTAETKLDDGTIDIAVALMPKGASGYYTYSKAYFKDACFLAAKKGAVSKQLSGSRVGYIGTVTTHVKTSPYLGLFNAYLEAHEEVVLDKANKVSYSSYSDMLMALERGDIDFCVITELFYAKYQGEYPMSKTSLSLGSVDYAVAASTDCPAFIQVANMTLDDMQTDGTLDAMYEKYGLDVYMHRDAATGTDAG